MKKQITITIVVFLVFFISLTFAFIVTHGDMNLFARDSSSHGYNYVSFLDNLKAGKFEVIPPDYFSELYFRNGKAHTYAGPFPSFLRGAIELFFKRGETDWTRISVFLAVIITVASLSLAYFQVALKTTKSFSTQCYYTFLFILTISFGTPLLSMFSYANIYEEAITWGFAWNSIFICSLIALIYSDKVDLRLLFLLSISSGFALLSRTSSGLSSSIMTIFLAMVLAIITINKKVKSNKLDTVLKWLRWTKLPISNKHLVLAFIALLIPWLLCIGFQLKLNYERWGNPLTLLDYKYYEVFINKPARLKRFYESGGFFNPLRMPHGFFNYFVPTKNYFSESFPYIKLSHGVPDDFPYKSKILKPIILDWVEVGIPVTISSPCLVITAILGLAALTKVLGGLFVILFLSFIIQNIIILEFIAHTLRYSVDFLPSLIIPSLASFSILAKFDNKGEIYKLLSRIILLVITLISIYTATHTMLLQKLLAGHVIPKAAANINLYFSTMDTFLSNPSHIKEYTSRLKLLNWEKNTFLKVLIVRGNSKLSNNLQEGQLIVNELNGTISWFNGKYWLPIRNYDNQFELSSYGPIKMKIKFPTGVTVPQPLLVTGIPGAGNFIYVNYLPNNKIAFGHTPWGINGTVGNPISINPKQFYTLEISLGNLYPNIPENKEFLDSITITLDGKKVFYLNSSDELVKIRSKIHYFENRIKILETLLKDLNSSPEHYYYASQRLLGRIDADYNRSDFQFKVDDTLEITNPDVTSVSQALNKARAYRDELIAMDNELYPTNGHITIGRNEIGGNSCTTSFSGEIKYIEHLGFKKI